MKYIVQLFVTISIAVMAGDEGVLPRELTVDLPKKCQVLMLHKTPSRKAPKIITYASYGDIVENMGCIRAITRTQLENTPAEQRDYMAWKHPVWCRVAVGKKEGWVLQQYLKNEFLPEDFDDE